MRAVGFLLLLLATLVAAPPAPAETAQDILGRRRALEEGAHRWTDRHETMKMRLVGEGRDEGRVLDIDSYEKRSADGRSSAVAFLRAPADVRGTAFLRVRDAGQPSQQWIYLPWSRSTRRVARPSGEAFMGSDLSYVDIELLRDMPTWPEKEVTARLLRQEDVDGVPSHVVSIVPRQSETHYVQVVVWLGVRDLIARRIDLHDETSVQKRIHQSDIRDAGGIPIPRKIEIETLAAKTKTEIVVADVRLNEGLDESLFTKAALERGAP